MTTTTAAAAAVNEHLILPPIIHLSMLLPLQLQLLPLLHQRLVHYDIDNKDNNNNYYY